MVETHRADAVAAVAQGRDFASAGATHQPHAAEVLLQGLAESFEVVFRRAEEQYETQVRVKPRCFAFATSATASASLARDMAVTTPSAGSSSILGLTQ